VFLVLANVPQNSKLPLFTLASPIFFLKKRATSARGPKTKKCIGLKMKITLADIHPCLAFFFYSVNGA